QLIRRALQPRPTAGQDRHMTISTEYDADDLDVIATGTHLEVTVDMVGAHQVMTALRSQDVRRGGCWLFAANVWQRFDRSWGGPDTPDGAQLVGTIYVTHGAPTAYEVTINRATVTPHGESRG